jgi:hypothetical protein
MSKAMLVPVTYRYFIKNIDKEFEIRLEMSKKELRHEGEAVMSTILELHNLSTRELFNIRLFKKESKADGTN